MSRLIENLEGRRLFHSAISVSVNFQPLNAPRAPGLLTDYGAVYGVRRGGISYGWSQDSTANSVDRNLTKIQKNDTFISMQAGGNRTWDFAVENGLYNVYIVAGDPGAFNDRMAITVENQVAVSGVTKRDRRYLEGLTNVLVTDGKITVGNAPWAVNNKICYIGIVSTEETSENTMTVSTPRPNANETGPVAGRFTVTRTGDLDVATVVPVTMGGTATNATDYGRFGTKLTFAAGVASIDLPVKVFDDGVDEGNETVTMTIGPVTGYTVVESSGTVTIADAGAPVTPPSTTPTAVTWASKANRPVAASELISAEVGGVLYTMGGFVDNTFHPSKANYAYDVATNAWTRKADLPVGLTHSGVAADSTSIYIAGGYPGNGSGGQQTFSTKTVYRYDVSSDSYSTLPDLPAARGAGSLALLGRTLYYIAGDNPSRQDVTDVYALNLDNTGAGWTTKASLPAPRNHAAALSLNGFVYLIGGQTAQDAQLTTFPNVYRYNPSTDAWTTVASMPGGRSHITDSTFVYNGKIIVLAGQSAYESALATNLEYNPATNKWTQIASLPAQRFSGAGHVVGNKFVYSGGYTGGFKNNTYVGTIA